MITSPGYPGNYPDNAYCVWYLSVPAGYGMLMQIMEMDTEENYDFLDVYNGGSPNSAIDLLTQCVLSINNNEATKVANIPFSV